MGAFTIERMVQFAETDQAGVMHFSNFFRVMEEVEHAFWRSVGSSVHRQDASGAVISWPRVSVRCDFQAAVRFEDVLTVTLRVTRIGEKSATYSVAFAQGGRTVATGAMSVVCCKLADGGRFESIPIPPDARRSLERIAPDLP